MAPSTLALICSTCGGGLALLLWKESCDTFRAGAAVWGLTAGMPSADLQKPCPLGPTEAEPGLAVHGLCRMKEYMRAHSDVPVDAAVSVSQHHYWSLPALTATLTSQIMQLRQILK